MRRIFVRALSAVTLACTVAAPALAGSTDYLLKLGGVEGDSGKAETQDDKHKNQIEILSYSWGETRKISKVDSIAIKQGTSDAPRANDRLRTAGPKDGWPSSSAAQAGGHSMLGASDRAGAGGVRVAVGDVNGDGGGASAHQRQKEIGAVPAAAAPKPKSGTLEYLNRTRQKELRTPPSTGSLTVIVAPGHGLCTAGRSLGTLTLAGSSGPSYVLDGVTVVGCEAAATDDRPAESLSLNYSKVTVRGWDPEKKEE